MMKQTILLILAMCLAFAMPAQASEGCHPSVSVDAGEATPTLVVADDKVASERTMRQLEAADLYLTSIEKFKVTDDVAPTPAQWPDGSGAMHEVGWQS